MTWRSIQAGCLVACWCAGGAAAAVADTATEEAYLGAAVRGLQGSVETERATYRVNHPIDVTVVLTNTSEQPINIDLRSENWSVQIFDERLRLLSAVRRPPHLPPIVSERLLTLHPGEHWRLTFKDLSVSDEEIGTRPAWRHPALPAGTYWIGADYGAASNPGYFRLWSGVLRCRPARITVR
ncbi:MAG: hypothetical protein HY597_04595 [Candidatus Omnitrophica bacterium]|nr:hypothetical protein [Candidatus Omnitrophota bacterium]